MKGRLKSYSQGKGIVTFKPASSLLTAPDERGRYEVVVFPGVLVHEVMRRNIACPEHVPSRLQSSLQEHLTAENADHAE